MLKKLLESHLRSYKNEPIDWEPAALLYYGSVYNMKPALSYEDKYSIAEDFWKEHVKRESAKTKQPPTEPLDALPFSKEEEIPIIQEGSIADDTETQTPLDVTSDMESHVDEYIKRTLEKFKANNMRGKYKVKIKDKDGNIVAKRYLLTKDIKKFVEENDDTLGYGLHKYNTGKSTLGSAISKYATTGDASGSYVWISDFLDIKPIKSKHIDKIEKELKELEASEFLDKYALEDIGKVKPTKKFLKEMREWGEKVKLGSKEE